MLELILRWLFNRYPVFRELLWLAIKQQEAAARWQ